MDVEKAPKGGFFYLCARHGAQRREWRYLIGGVSPRGAR